MSVTAAIRRMLDAGLTLEQALTAAECFETVSPAPKSARQERNARYYQRKASERRLNSDDQDVSDGGADLLSPEGSSPTPPSPKPLSSIPPSPPKGGSSPTNFETFWSIYPNRVGKREAEKSFIKALKRADLETILAGLRRYASKTDDRPWCNPATWLNQDRWEDAPADVVPHRSASPPPAETVASFSRKQLLEQRQYDDTDNSSGRVVQIDAHRLDSDTGGTRTFTVPRNVFGSF